MQKELLARLVDSLGTEEFPYTLMLWLHSVVNIDGFVVLAYPPTGELTVIHDGAPDANSISCNTVYRAGMWVLSPLYLHARMGSSGFFHISDICGPGFKDSRFYKEYYRDAGINDHVAFIIQSGDSDATVVSLERSKALPSFSECEIETLREWEPFVTSLLRGNWRGLQGHSGKSHEVFGSRQSGIRSIINNRKLSAREEDVMLAVLRGLPNKLIARELDISVETVKVHCTRIMKKFDVSSRSELFSEVLKNIISVSP